MWCVRLTLNVCEPRGTDNVQRQISKATFVFVILQIFFTTRTVLGIEIENVSRIFSSFSRGIFSHVTRLDKSCLNENI